MEITIDIAALVTEMDSNDINDVLDSIHSEDEDYISDFVKENMCPSDIWNLDELISDLD